MEEQRADLLSTKGGKLLITPEYKPIEKGIVVREVVNPKPISKFPDDAKRDMHLRYTVSQMMREGYDEMEFVDFHTAIKYELVPEKGFDNLYDAYVDWWKSNMGYIVHNVYMTIKPSLLDPSVIYLLENKKAMDEIESEGIQFQKYFGSMAVNYSKARGKGRPNLWQAYRDWWDKNEKLIDCWTGKITNPPPSWTSKSFYPINPTEDKIEKENTMIYTVNKEEIRKTIRCTKDYIKLACNKLDSMSFEPGDKCQNSLQIASEIKQIANGIERAVNHLKFLGELQGASSIQMNEQEYARFNIDLSAELLLNGVVSSERILTAPLLFHKVMVGGHRYYE